MNGSAKRIENNRVCGSEENTANKSLCKEKNKLLCANSFKNQGS